MSKWKGYLIAGAGILIAWQVGAKILGSVVLPTPIAIIASLGEAWRGGFGHHFYASAKRVVGGILIALFSAVPLGLLMGRSERLDRILSPVVFVLYPIPKIVFLPVILVLLGLTDRSRIFLVALIVFFQILVTTRDASKGVGPETIASMKSLGATEGQIIWHAILPASLPGILTALRIGTGTSIAVLFLVESFATGEGLGYYIVDAWGKIDYVSMFVGILGMGFLGIALYEMWEVLERKLCRWKYVK
ncbi:MAG: ABC transporter permease [bacterium]